MFHNDDIWIDDAGCYAGTILLLLRLFVATAVVGSSRTQHVDRIDDLTMNDDDIIIREINAAASLLPGQAPVCREVYILHTYPDYYLLKQQSTTINKIWQHYLEECVCVCVCVCVTGVLLARGRNQNTTHTIMDACHDDRKWTGRIMACGVKKKT